MAFGIKHDRLAGMAAMLTGVAAMVPRPTRFVDSLLIAADAGLREARRKGGNTVRFSSTLR